MVFVKVKCEKCNNEQVVFDSASSAVKCLICGEELVKPTGGKAKVIAEIVEVFE